MTHTRRTGFTLVELLVVMSLVIVLAGLTVAVAESGAFGSQKVVSAADRASGWLLIAKQRALRDQRPRGVRFLLTSVNPSDPSETRYTCREAQYIEIPDAWTPTGGVGVAGAPQPFIAFVYHSGPPNETYVWQDPPLDIPNPNNFSTKTPTNNRRVFVVLPSPTDQADFQARVQSGNLLVLPNQGGTYRIDQILSPATGGITIQANGQTFGGPQVRELALGRNTRTPGGTEYTYPDLGAANSGLSAGTQIAPPTACKTETRFAFTAGIDGGQFGTGGAQPLVGEPLLQLTGDSIIDFRLPNPAGGAYNPSQEPYPTTGPGTPTPPFFPRTTRGVAAVSASGGLYFDVLFSPSGQVLGARDGLITLWVRNPTRLTDAPEANHPRLNAAGQLDTQATFDAAGEQVLVTVYPRTGAIATHPVAAGTDPYTAAKDGLNSGL